MNKNDSVTWSVREALSDRELQELFSAVYKRPNTVPFHTILENCLTWVSARKGGRLIGFANIIWDGLYHALIVDRAARDDESGELHHQVALKVLEVLRRDYPTVTKIHIECDEREISGLSRWDSSAGPAAESSPKLRQSFSPARAPDVTSL